VVYFKQHDSNGGTVDVGGVKDTGGGRRNKTRGGRGLQKRLTVWKPARKDLLITGGKGGERNKKTSGKGTDSTPSSGKTAGSPLGGEKHNKKNLLPCVKTNRGQEKR